MVDEVKICSWIGSAVNTSLEDEQEVVLRNASLQGKGLIAVAVGIVPEKDFIFQERPPPVRPSSVAVRLPALIGWSDVIDMVDTSVVLVGDWLPSPTTSTIL